MKEQFYLAFYSLNRNIHLSGITEVQFTELSSKFTYVNSDLFSFVVFFVSFFFTNITNVHPLVQYCHSLMRVMYRIFTKELLPSNFSFASGNAVCRSCVLLGWGPITLLLHIMRTSRYLRSYSTLVPAGATPLRSADAHLQWGLSLVPSTKLVLAAESKVAFMYFLQQRITQSCHTFSYVLKNNQAWCFVVTVAATPAWWNYYALVGLTSCHGWRRMDEGRET